MEFRRIKAIVIIVSLALLSIIVVQLYWAYASYALSRKTFNANVMESLRRTVADLNENLTCFELFSKTQIKAGEAFYMLRLRKDSSSFDTIPMFSEFTNEYVPFRFSRMRSNMTTNLEAVFRFRVTGDSSLAEDTILRSAEGITVKNFQEKLSDKTPLYLRYDTLLTDSLLENYLSGFSINDSFRFAYIDPVTANILYASPGSDSVLFARSDLKCRLTNSEYFSVPYDLVIYFPEYNKIIFAGLYPMLMIASLVITVLIVSFYFFIRIIYRQRKLSEMKNDFINNMTHEFKTPLANISLVLETLSANEISQNGNNKFFRILGQETERLRENIEKILHVARLEKDKVHLSFEKLDLHQVIQKAVSGFETILESEKNQIIYDFSAIKTEINADETHLINVICNLIDNAVKYSGKDVQIRIRTWNSGDGLYFSVKDNGMGISRDAQKKIFDKFFRVQSGDIHNIKGFGLGLTYVKSIIEFHNGSIRVSSQPGTGSEFEIFFPLN